MKKIVVVLVNLVVTVLIGVGNAFAHIPEPSLGPEWKLVFRGSHGSTYYVNTKRITYLPGGIVKFWELWVPRGGQRRVLVNAFKNYFLSKGKNSNNAKRLWYTIGLNKFNCRTHQFADLKRVFYSFGKAVLYSHSFQREEWYDIPPRSPGEKIENYVCNEAPPSKPAQYEPAIPEPPSKPAQYEPAIPEPPLSSKWKLVFTGFDGTGWYYVNTKRITYLSKGVIEVWELWYAEWGKTRRKLVNALKKDLLSKGKDPNKAERLWYVKFLYKFNCKNHLFAPLKLIYYIYHSFYEKPVLEDESSYQHEKWKYIPPGSPEEKIAKFVCE